MPNSKLENYEWLLLLEEYWRNNQIITFDETEKNETLDWKLSDSLTDYYNKPFIAITNERVVN